MKHIKEAFSLGLILIFAGVIYTFKLSSIPNGFYVDEAVVAYNAMSILETGRDAFGQPHPVLFRLLGSYTPPLFIYVSAMFIKFFGNGVAVFRSISVISAIVSIVFFYLFTKKLGIYKKRASYVLITLFYAISPWFIFNARLGYEVTLAYTFFNIGVYFLAIALDKPQDYIPAVIFLSLSTYTAHTQRFLAPIFVIFYLIIFKNTIFCKRNINSLIVSIVLLFVIHIPHFTVITTPAFWVKNERMLEGSGRMVKNIANQTFSYLSIKNLFYKLSDIDLQHTVPELSVMYNWMVVPFLVGVFWMIKRRKERNMKLLILLFTTTLIPAVMSGEFISIQRALPFLLPLMIVIGLGIDKIAGKIPPLLFAVSSALLLFYSFTLLYRSYFVLFPIERAEAWNNGYARVANFIEQNSDKKYLIDNSRNPRNYILLLYYLNYPAGKYQEEVDIKYKTDYYRSLPPENEYLFSNIEVRPIDWKTDPCVEQIIIGDSLTVSETQSFEHRLEQVFFIKDHFGNKIMIGFKTNPLKKCVASTASG